MPSGKVTSVWRSTWTFVNTPLISVIVGTVIATGLLVVATTVASVVLAGDPLAWLRRFRAVAGVPVPAWTVPVAVVVGAVGTYLAVVRRRSSSGRESLTSRVVQELPNLSLSEIKFVSQWLYYLRDHLGEDWRVDLEEIDPETVPKHRYRLSLKPPVVDFAPTGTEPQSMFLKTTLDRLVRDMRNEALRRR